MKGSEVFCSYESSWAPNASWNWRWGERHCKWNSWFMCWFTAAPGCYVTWLSLPQRLAPHIYPGLRAGQALVGILIKTPEKSRQFDFHLKWHEGWPPDAGPNLVLGSAPRANPHLSGLNYPDGSSLLLKDHKGPSLGKSRLRISLKQKCISFWIHLGWK